MHSLTRQRKPPLLCARLCRTSLRAFAVDTRVEAHAEAKAQPARLLRRRRPRRDSHLRRAEITEVPFHGTLSKF